MATLPSVGGRQILKCKTFGHAWEEIPNRKYQSPAYLYVVLRCTSCTTERHELVNWEGNIVERSYHYPENYADFPKGTKPELRRRYFGQRLTRKMHVVNGDAEPTPIRQQKS